MNKSFPEVGTVECVRGMKVNFATNAIHGCIVAHAIPEDQPNFPPNLEIFRWSPV